MLPFSVLMSVYINDDPSHLNSALRSLLDQTLLPSEIVLVVDGPISKENQQVVESYVRVHPDLFNVRYLSKNMGLGHALRIGLEACSNELVARMDSDDICLPHRFERQVDLMERRTDIAVVGSNIEEFNEVPGDLNKFRIMPETNEKLLRYAKFRSPVNHPSIMFRRSAVLDSGNYNGDIRLFEDYSLFVKMLLKGYKFYNIQEVLLYFRIGDGLRTIKRRSGWHYIKSEMTFIRHARRIGFLSNVAFVQSVLLKIPIRLLPPKTVLTLYNLLLRRG